jgi:hypothetical protein
MTPPARFGKPRRIARGRRTNSRGAMTEESPSMAFVYTKGIDPRGLIISQYGAADI